MSQPEGNHGQHQHESHVDGKELTKKTAGVRVLGMGIELQADEAGETCDRRAQPADVHAEQKGISTLGESGEQ